MADFGYLLDDLELTAESEDSPLDTALTPIVQAEADSNNNNTEDSADDSDGIGGAWLEQTFSPVAQLESYVRATEGRSRNGMADEERLLAARELLPRAVEAVETPEQRKIVLDCALQLCRDHEATVRSVTLRHFTKLVEGLSPTPEDLDAVVEALLPLLVISMWDGAEPVRLAAHGAVIELLQSTLAARSDLQREVARRALEVISAADPGERVRCDALSFVYAVAKIVPLDVRLDVFVPLVVRLSGDQLYNVRHHCPWVISQLAEATSRQVADEKLLPAFLSLARDDVFNVRKACGSNIGAIAPNVTPQALVRDVLPCFLALAGDRSRWVRTAAVSSLGYVISAFVQSPPVDGLDFHNDFSYAEEPTLPALAATNAAIAATSEAPWTDEAQEFNSFQFWRAPNTASNIDELLATLDLDMGGERSTDGELGAAATEASAAPTQTASGNARASSAGAAKAGASPPRHAGLYIVPPPNADAADAAPPAPGSHAHSSETLLPPWLQSRMPLPKRPRASGESELCIPDSLLALFCRLVDREFGASLDEEEAGVCAYNMPAVVWALGADHWHRIRATYTALLNHENSDVRDTLAASLHDVARILGPQITERDLVPILNMLLKDWPEVRLSVLKNLHITLAQLPQRPRRLYLPLLERVQHHEAHNVWRLRKCLADVVAELAWLYSEDDVVEFLQPLALSLACDRVAAARRSGERTLAAIQHRLASRPELARGAAMAAFHRLALADMPTDEMDDDTIGSTAGSYDGRLSYVSVSDHVLRFGDVTLFEECYLEHISHYKDDAVPNIRLRVAHVCQRCLCTGKLSPGAKTLVEEALEALRQDADVDVRRAAGANVPLLPEESEDAFSS